MPLNMINTTTPLDDDYVKDGATRIREIKAALVQSLPTITDNLTPEVSTDLLNNLVENFEPDTAVGGIDFSGSKVKLDTLGGLITPNVVVSSSGGILNKEGDFLTKGDAVALLNSDLTQSTSLSDKVDSEFASLESKVASLSGTGNSATKDVAEIQTVIDEIVLALPSIAAEQFDDYIDNAFSVGDFHLSADGTNPATRFGGTWVQVDPDTGLASVTRGAPSAASDGKEGIVGKNVITAPLIKHTHPASVKLKPLPNHKHATGLWTAPFVQVHAAGGIFYAQGHGDSDSASSGTPTGTVTIGNAGTANATLDLRGARVSVYFWKKIA